MIDFAVKGIIFDIDDTLLDNGAGVPGASLHERAYLVAIHAAGQYYHIVPLIDVTATDQYEAFCITTTVEAGVWQLLCSRNIVQSGEVDAHHYLVRDIIHRKDELYINMLHREGRAVGGAIDFIHRLGPQLSNTFAIASMANRRDIDTFLDQNDLHRFFATHRVTSRELVTHPKPHPEIFDRAFRSLDIPEGDRSFVCAFEDDPRGIAAAKAAGLYTCAITTRYNRQALAELEIAPDVIADSYAEFCELFASH